MYNLLYSYGVIQKLIVFRKKNFQAFVELESEEKAQSFKDALSTAHFGDQMSLKIQFTLKKELVVSQNTMMEFDFTRSDRDSYLEFSSQRQKTISSSDYASHLATPEQRVRGGFLAMENSASSGFGYSPNYGGAGGQRGNLESRRNGNANGNRIQTDANARMGSRFFTPNSGFAAIGSQNEREVFSRSARQETKGICSKIDSRAQLEAPSRELKDPRKTPSKLSFKEKFKLKMKRERERKRQMKSNRMRNLESNRDSENTKNFSRAGNSDFEANSQNGDVGILEFAAKTIPMNFRESMVKLQSQANRPEPSYTLTPENEQTSSTRQTENKTLMDAKVTPNHKQNSKNPSRNKLIENVAKPESFLESSLKMEDTWKSEEELSATNTSDNRTADALENSDTNILWKPLEHLPGPNRESFFDLVNTQKKERDEGTTAKKKKTIINPNIIINNFSFKLDSEALKKGNASKALFQEKQPRMSEELETEALERLVGDLHDSEMESSDLIENPLNPNKNNNKMPRLTHAYDELQPKSSTKERESFIGISEFESSHPIQNFFQPMNSESGNGLETKDEARAERLSGTIEGLQELQSQNSDKNASNGNIFRFFDQDRSLNESLQENSGFDGSNELSSQQNQENGLFGALRVSANREVDRFQDSRGFEGYSKSGKKGFTVKESQGSESEFRNRIRGSLSRLGDDTGFSNQQKSGLAGGVWTGCTGNASGFADFNKYTRKSDLLESKFNIRSRERYDCFIIIVKFDIWLTLKIFKNESCPLSKYIKLNIQYLRPNTKNEFC